MARMRVLIALTATVLAVALLPAVAAAQTPEPAPRPWASGADGDAERFLLEADVIDIKPVGEGVTAPLLLTLQQGERSGRAIFKSVDEIAPWKGAGEDPRIADRWHYEIAAYRIDRLIGIGRVPPTVARPLGELRGSWQLWIDNAENGRKRPEIVEGLKGKPTPPAWAHDVWLLDALVFNADRNPGNLIVSKETGEVHAIDHSRAFRVHAFLPSLVDGKPIALDAARRAALAGLERAALVRALSGLLDDAQIDAVLARRDIVLAAQGAQP